MVDLTSRSPRSRPKRCAAAVSSSSRSSRESAEVRCCGVGALVSVSRRFAGFASSDMGQSSFHQKRASGEDQAITPPAGVRELLEKSAHLASRKAAMRALLRERVEPEDLSGSPRAHELLHGLACVRGVPLLVSMHGFDHCDGACSVRERAGFEVVLERTRDARFEEVSVGKKMRNALVTLVPVHLRFDRKRNGREVPNGVIEHIQPARLANLSTERPNGALVQTDVASFVTPVLADARCELGILHVFCGEIVEHRLWVTLPGSVKIQHPGVRLWRTRELAMPGAFHVAHEYRERHVNVRNSLWKATRRLRRIGPHRRTRAPSRGPPLPRARKRGVEGSVSCPETVRDATGSRRVRVLAAPPRSAASVHPGLSCPNLTRRKRDGTRERPRTRHHQQERDRLIDRRTAQELRGFTQRLEGETPDAVQDQVARKQSPLTPLSSIQHEEAH